MKKRLTAGLLSLVLSGVLLLAGCGSKEESAVKVTLNEVAHSVFYAPQYVALEKGYFAEEGLDLELVNGYGADKTMTAVLSGEADIGFMGAEASIYVPGRRRGSSRKFCPTDPESRKHSGITAADGKLPVV